MMKTNQFILMIALFAGTIAFGQEMAFKTEANNKSTINWEKQFFDFGQLKKGETAMAQFMFTNTGKEAVLIKNVKTSCGCTATEYPKEPVLPGEKAYIKVTYDTKRTGAFSKTISVYMNNPKLVSILKIKGTVN